MHCDCCDRFLSDAEATNTFESGEYVSMCSKCIAFLPKDLKVIARQDEDIDQLTPDEDSYWLDEEDAEVDDE